MFYLVCDNTRQLLLELFSPRCAKVVTACVCLRQAVCAAVAILTLPTGEVTEGQFFIAAVTAIVSLGFFLFVGGTRNIGFYSEDR